VGLAALVGLVVAVALVLLAAWSGTRHHIFYSNSLSCRKTKGLGSGSRMVPKL